MDIEHFDESGVKMKAEPLETETLEHKKQAVENCCDRISGANARISELKMEYQSVNAYLSDIQIIEGLSDKQEEEIVKCAKR